MRGGVRGGGGSRGVRGGGEQGEGDRGGKGQTEWPRGCILKKNKIMETFVVVADLFGG